jgi:hypothetical protein
MKIRSLHISKIKKIKTSKSLKEISIRKKRAEKDEKGPWIDWKRQRNRMEAHNFKDL